MSKLVECKVCHQEVPIEVENCPNCGTNQRNWFQRHKIMTGFISLFIVISIIGIVGFVIYIF